MSRRKQRSAFDEVSEFDRGRIVAYEIVDNLSGKSVAVLDETKQLKCGYVTYRFRRVQRTDLVDRIHLSAPLHVKTDKLAVVDRSVTSRTVAQHIEYVTHHLVSAFTIRRRLQQSGLSARRPLFDLSLTQNQRRLRRQWCDGRMMWVAEWN
ncbi:transposable element Tcb1 transposase [Trichonephila clavipes]|nr:transposable element Tcb1 transposase [Trichonephila clavipes]